MNKIPVYNIVLGLADGIQIMSLVDSPGIESDFIAFAKDKQPMKFSLDEEQHIVFGCALRADYPIYRYDDKMGEYYVIFTKDVINQLYQKFMIEQRTDDVNLDHSVMTDGVTMIQSFIKDTTKGISPIGFEDITDGSWFCAYKVENEEVWKGVKEGKFNGFSVEGYFMLQPQEMSKVDPIDELVDEILN